MKLKTLVATMALTCASSVALAQNYQFEVGANYTDIDIDNAGSEDFFGVYGEYHFQPVRIGNNPLAEAAFINRSSNIYVSGSEDLDVLQGGVDFYIPDSIFYVGAEVVRTDRDGEDNNNDFGVRLGLTPIAGLLVWTEYYDEPGYDPNINAKYVMPLGGGNFLNLEAGYADADEDDVLSLAADFYFDQTFSIGAGYTDFDFGDSFSLRARKFFTNEISGQLEYTKIDGDSIPIDADVITIGASFRF